MNSAIERLLSLRVADVMTKKVVSISSRDSMAVAAGKLQEHSISGLPVVDDQERCIGVLSALDFAKHQTHTATSHKDKPDRGGVVSSDIGPVSQHMTRDVHSIAASQPLLTAARVMCSNHIHRLPVLDDHQRPIGMITSLDVVAALVHAIEE